MWLITIRDLQWRRRRFVLAVLATGLAFAVTLLMNGTVQHFRNESSRTVGLYRADNWLVVHGATGPFTTSQFVSTANLPVVRATAGVEAASPLLIVRSTIDRLDVNIVGYELGGRTQPTRLQEGNSPTQRGEAVVDESLKRKVGSTLTFAGSSYRVVATTTDTTFYFGGPTVFLPIEDVQDQFLVGERLASTIVIWGAPNVLPAATDVLTTAQVKDDLDRPLAQTTQTLRILNSLLWIMAAGTIGAMVYLTALERTRDIAVFKATGASNRSLVAGLSAEAIVMSVSAAAIAVALAAVLGQLMPFPVEVPVAAYVQLLIVALAVGLAASLAGTRRVARIDPALAFGGV